MAYQITYYYTHDMRHRTRDTDTIGTLDHYPAPTGLEAAIAISTDDQTSVRYGYNGEWHTQPPRESIVADIRDRQRASDHRRDEIRRAVAQLPTTIVERADSMTISLTVAREHQDLSAGDLTAAASQDNADPVARAYYRAIARAAEESRTLGRRVAVDLS